MSKTFGSKLNFLFGLVGFDFSKLFQSMINLPRFIKSVTVYNKKNKENHGFPARILTMLPNLTDFKEEAGIEDPQYFYQDLWAARKIYQAAPQEHIDIGSRIDGFIAHLLTFMPVTIIDIRPLDVDLEGLTYIQEDACLLSRFKDNSVESISSLHAVEHFGLGRYGDPIDPDACFKVMRALARVLKPGGTLYFAVPIGRERLMFNAHRIFHPRTILETFNGLKLKSFSAVDDNGKFHEDTRLEEYTTAYYSLGCFEFTK